MALTDDELQRVRAELDDNVLAIGALPYVGHRHIYDVIQDYVAASAVAATSSSTTVATTGPATLTLGTTTGLLVGTKVQLDADDVRETVTVRAIAGATISVVCRKLHSGTYPVEVESAQTLIRGALSDLVVLQDLINEAAASAGIKKVDEVEFFGDGTARSVLDERRRAQHARRLDLARLCGLGSLLAINSRHGGSVEVY